MSDYSRWRHSEETVFPGMRFYDDILIFEDELEKNGISSVEEIEYFLCINDSVDREIALFEKTFTYKP